MNILIISICEFVEWSCFTAYYWMGAPNSILLEKVVIVTDRMIEDWSNYDQNRIDRWILCVGSKNAFALKNIG